MAVHYLVDFENVHLTGLEGIKWLTMEDSIYLFHTNAADRIPLGFLDNVSAWVRVIIVPPGDQSLDMHLVSFLGYLMGKEEDAETRYAIVSHDSDYRKVTDFWNKAYQMHDKIQCMHCIGQGIRAPYVAVCDQPEENHAQNRQAIHEFIVKTFRNYGEIGMSGMPCMLVSELCARLNCFPEYLSERNWTNLKPMQYLIDECRDYLWITKSGHRDWAYLLTQSEKECRAGSAESRQAEEAMPEEDEPDILEMGDLTIEDPLPEEELLAREIMPEEPEEEQPAGDVYLAAAMAVLENAGIEERNDRGHVRASVVRDELMKMPEFRAALKESGQKPIPYLRELFADGIEVYREKGIFWMAVNTDSSPADAEADSARDEAISERKKVFFEKAFSNIRKQLTDSGMDKEVADEIAGIFMHSHSADEPRKEIHTLLCRRFGPKLGAKYYRQTAMYVH